MENINLEFADIHITPSKERKNFRVVATLENKNVCKCTINTDTEKDTWQISGWYTEPDYKNKGIGRATLKHTLHIIADDYKQRGLPLPKNIEYIWDGSHEYVYKWLEENFQAKSKGNRAVMKYCFDDDWSSHIYVLNRDAVFNYFEINEEKTENKEESMIKTKIKKNEKAEMIFNDLLKAGIVSEDSKEAAIETIKGTLKEIKAKNQELKSPVSQKTKIIIDEDQGEEEDMER